MARLKKGDVVTLKDCKTYQTDQVTGTDLAGCRAVVMDEPCEREGSIDDGRSRERVHLTPLGQPGGGQVGILDVPTDRIRQGGVLKRVFGGWGKGKVRPNCGYEPPPLDPEVEGGDII